MYVLAKNSQMFYSEQNGFIIVLCNSYWSNALLHKLLGKFNYYSHFRRVFF